VRNFKLYSSVSFTAYLIIFLRVARIFTLTKIFKEFVGIYVFLLPPTCVLFATAIAFTKFNIGLFATEAVRTPLTVKVTLRGSCAYNSSGQAR
jgi:hypothetical protein